MFSPDGTLLYTACRQASDILCWDIRNTVEVVARFGRQATTNQRVKFDLTPNGATLVAGSQDGTVLLYDARHDGGNAEPYAVFKAHEDSANGVSVHPSLPLLATASGQRKFAAPMLSDADSSDDSSSDEEQHTVENTLTRWSLDHTR
jgi:WD40 repeat protein